ncbi:MAG: histidine kinase [Balneolaceae bacterium]
MRKRSSSSLVVKVVFIFIASANGVLAQQQMPPIGLEQFRDNISEIESSREKLDQYLEASMRFAPQMPDSVFTLAEEVRNLKGLEPEKQEAYYLFVLANAWRTLNKDSVVYYAEQATQKLRNLGEHDSYLNMTNLLGMELSRQKDVLKADSVFKNAIAYTHTLEKVDYPVKYIYGNLGSLYSMVGAHDLAINMYERFLDMEDNPGDRCNINSKLAVSLSELSEYEQAIKLLTPCLEYQQLPPPIQCIVRSNLSRMYDEIGDKDRSFALMKEAVTISTNNRIPNLEISQLIELGIKYLEAGKLQEADSVKNQLLNIKGRINPHFNIDRNIFFADLELSQNDYRQAIHYANQAIELAERSRLQQILKNIYLTRAKANEELGDIDNALADMRLHSELEESKHNRKTEENLAMMNVRYQLQNKEAQLLTVSDQLQTVKVRELVIILLLVIIGLYAMYRYRLHYLLQEVNTRNRIARDLHDDLSGTLSSISFFSEAAKRVKPDAEKSVRYLQMIDKSAVEAKDKINDIIWAIDPANDDWSVFLNKCKRFAADAFDSKDLEYEIKIGDNFTAPASLELRQNLWLIFKEMVNNLVTHSEADKASINFVQKEKTICLEVKDNGVGFDAGEETDRHGIKNIKHRAEQIGAKANLISSQGQGAIWKMELDL